VESAPPNTTIIIGTEVNLIERVALENPDKKVLVLQHSLCPNMFKINLKNLLWALDHVGQVNVVKVPEEIKADARMALDRMLALEPKTTPAKRGDLVKERQVAGVAVS
jgi:quinolinate synthase